MSKHRELPDSEAPTLTFSLCDCGEPDCNGVIVSVRDPESPDRAIGAYLAQSKIPSLIAWLEARK